MTTDGSVATDLGVIRWRVGWWLLYESRGNGKGYYSEPEHAVSPEDYSADYFELVYEP
jgi:hypothetical protein